MRGYFVTFEGGEGAGKSSQMAALAGRLREWGHDVLLTREPGGSTGAEAVRHVILSGAAEPYGPAMEALLFAAARSDHVEQVIRPAVKDGSIVLCDRYMDSTRVYQGVTGDLVPAFITALERTTVNGMIPDLTLILDLDPETGMARAASRRGKAAPDRFEKETLDIHRRRRDAFLDIARREPERCVVVDAGQAPDIVAARIEDIVRKRIDARAQSTQREEARGE